MSTGDMKGAGSKADQLTTTPDDDPFADLARLIDEPWGSGLAVRAERDPVAAPIGESTVFDEEALAGVLDEEFHRSFEMHDDVATPATPADPLPREADTAANSYANWLAPRSASAATATSTASARTPASPTAAEAPLDDAIDNELEVALRGLSAPANPRGTPLHQSEAFVPARIEPLPVPQPRTKPLDDFDELIASELAAMTTAPQVQRVNEAWDGADSRPAAAAPQYHHAGLAQDDSQAFGVEPVGHQSGERRRGAAHRATAGMLAAGQGRYSPRSFGFGASVLVIALLGGAGAYYVFGNGGVAGSDEVLIVRADTEPVKVAPKDPGGRAVPNQNKAVYERVQSADVDVKPSQTTLLSAAEEPLELPSQQAPNDLPGVDLSPIGTARAAANGAGEESVRVADASAAAEPIAVLTPRRVRTLTVRPDGTLVTEETVPETSMADLRGENPAMIPAVSRPVDLAAGTADTAAADAAAETAAAGQPAPGMPVPALKPVRATPEPVRTAALATAQPEPQAPPAAVAPEPAIAPEPSVDPVTETASIAPPPPPAQAAPAAPAAGGYYVQISSQPSEAAAQESSQALGQRYASVIGGRNLVIQSADIPGKGTYYRVRVAAGSKDEAASLCSQLKSAGGSCFVAR
ncbi:SPOR domain-containing protein [Aurantimonas sp. A2-1-M11]|uniref:SPOR domain-containing protein n=1 Tax=Aurantimonas sp. A2-1-M11 TaxID=3113712 RepID=UPI002F947BDA